MCREKHWPPLERIGRDEEGHSLYLGEEYYVTSQNGSICVRRRNAEGFDEQTRVIQPPENPDNR